MCLSVGAGCVWVGGFEEYGSLILFPGRSEASLAHVERIRVRHGRHEVFNHFILFKTFILSSLVVLYCAVLCFAVLC